MNASIFTLANLVTFGNLFCGIYSMHLAMNGKFFLAAYLIFIAAVLDFLDGNIARLTKTETRFGSWFDSASDLISFGISPMVLIYVLLDVIPVYISWCFGFLYIICGAIRLVRYNMQLKNQKKDYFLGLPITLAAIIIATYALAYLQNRRAVIFNFLPLVIIILGMLMVSTIKYPRIKISFLK